VLQNLLSQVQVPVQHAGRSVDLCPSLLARGVGRHRGYGYGMLLLRPPQRRR